jgi:hypothetical protein
VPPTGPDLTQLQIQGGTSPTIQQTVESLGSGDPRFVKTRMGSQNLRFSSNPEKFIQTTETIPTQVQPRPLSSKELAELKQGRPTLTKSFGKLGTKPGEALKEIYFPKGPTASEIVAKYPDVGLEYAKTAAEELSPNMIRTFGPSLLTAGAVAAPFGFYDAPEEEPMEPAFGGVTSDQLIAGDPGRYVPGVPVDPPAYATLQDIRVANQGGEMFPRKTGYISGPGTETSDSVPAMLSDGEFVFTAKAVRGAGNGSRRNGVRNMYQMMKNFETQAA